jgi:signal transduction histidine kinase
VGLLPGAHIGIAAMLIVLLVTLVMLITGDRNRFKREIVTVAAAGQAHLRRRCRADDMLREAGPELPELIGSMACRLREPLAEISTETEALRGAAAALFTDDQHVLLDGVRSAARRLQELNEKLLEYAAADSVALHLRDVDLTALAADVAAERRALSTGSPPRITVSDLPTVHGDVTLLRQVLTNLVTNAVENTMPGQPARVAITAAPEGSSAWRIDVTDHGVGIPAGNPAQLFAAFYRAHQERPRWANPGLGLAVVRRIVQRHGGGIGADRNPGGGARFWFTLPCT